MALAALSWPFSWFVEELLDGRREFAGVVYEVDVPAGMQVQPRMGQQRVHDVGVGHWDDRIVGARHDQGLLAHRRQREQAGPDRTSQQLMQVANPGSGMQLPHKQLSDVFAMCTDGTAVELTGN